MDDGIKDKVKCEFEHFIYKIVNDTDGGVDW